MTRASAHTPVLPALALIIAAGPAATGAAAQLRTDAPPHPATQRSEHLVAPEQIQEWREELSNWGRWGPDDQLGTLNLITPEKRRRALRLAEDGEVVGLLHFVDTEPAVDSHTYVETRHWMPLYDEETGEYAALDAVAFGTHDGQLSHQDALCHYSAMWRGEEVTYNGYPSEVTGDGCVGELAIDAMGPGFLTRGILVDMPLLRGVEWLEPRTPIFPEDLEAWEEYAGVTVRPGDVLLVRTGRWAKREAEGPWNYAAEGAGLHASVLPWLHERGVALLVGDAVNDVQPSGVDGEENWRPIHTTSMVFMGLPLVDNGYLEDVAEEAEARQRWEFLITWTLLPLENGTASPFAAAAIF